MAEQPFFTNDAIVLGLLLIVLAVVFVTSSSENPVFKKFYTYVPPLLLCYFLPALLNYPLGLVSGEKSNLYFVASRYLLPACLVMLCLAIDLKGIINLGPKALIMFLAATAGIIIGGPVALFLVGVVEPEVYNNTGSEEIWRGLATVAGSWIGGGANQTAMKEVYGASNTLFASMIVVDVVVANLWMAFLLVGAGMSKKVDKWFKADSSAIDELRDRVEAYSASVSKIPTLTETIVLLAVAFGGTALAHWGADLIAPVMQQYSDTLNAWKLNSLTSSFFWLVVISTTVGLAVSFTKARRLEGVGAMRLGSVFIYILVATIGMKMNLREMFENWQVFKFLIAIGLIWMIVHISILLFVAWLIKAPFFFVAVGSQANVGGAASAPVVAAAFSPALAPVGVLLAVLGYALGTYGAIICAQLMQALAQ